MPRLIIDDREIAVPPGTKVIEAAEQLGIMIPRFCFHPALGSVGACRVCAVKCLQGPYKGVQMSCMIEAKDGMVVSTTDAEAIEFRRYVIELLMVNHPHDCPVCDEGGHCLLQDMTVSGGHGIRRFLGKKRTYPDQYLGPLVQHEMNRCIHCYRCARYYQEFAGYRDFGVMQIASHTYFGRSLPGVLESPFSGNLSDICPTGVFTDKPSRYKGRRWDFERSPAICSNCSLGCHTVVSVRYRELVRQEARYSAAVNGHFICDRGRFGFYFAQSSARPLQARAGGKQLAPAEGLRAAADKLEAAGKRWGPQAIACIGGVRSSIETQMALYRLARFRNWQGPAFFADTGAGAHSTAAVARLSEDNGVSLREIETADAVVVVGADPVNEAPMLALALRQAQRRGASVAVIDPRPVALPFRFTHVPLGPEELCRGLGQIISDGTFGAGEASHIEKDTGALKHLPRLSRPMRDELSAVAQLLDSSRKPIVVCGTDIAIGDLPNLAADAVMLLQAADKAAGLFYVMSGAGAYGGALLNDGSMETILGAIERGDVRGLVAVESDLLHAYPDRRRVEQALAQLELCVVLDCLDSAFYRRAHMAIPLATVYEAGGHFFNQEGRLQWSPPVFRGGEPVLRTGGGGHPPREYDANALVSGQPAGWQALNLLAGGNDLETVPGAGTNAGELFAQFASLAAEGGLPEDGWRLFLEPDTPLLHEPARFDQDSGSDGQLHVVFTELTFGSEVLSARSPCLAKVTPEPYVCLHPDDAGPLGVIDGSKVTIATGQGELSVTARITAKMAEGVLVLPRYFESAWQIFPYGNKRLSMKAIKPADGREGV